ncbi:hypothetical protein D5R93_10070 [Actinomyces lilanjuaniae]|uniref:GAF domain-containing protein n=2 Tax=Actinomycetaceae TaxID=2049 RepID=A0ABM6Z4N9_9ACTO|nr:hypothetical protein D5R93_10070 [Actinomyces lilanjuaniae]
MALLRRSWPTLGQGAGAILLGIWSVQTEPLLFLPGYTFLVVGAGMSVVSLVWGVVAGARHDDLRKEIRWSEEREKQYHQMIGAVMKVQAHRLLRLLVLESDSGGREDVLLSASRVTFYYCYDSRLYAVARFSRNLELDRPGRLSYPPGEGCIGFAYTKGRVAFERFPSDDEEWVRYNVSAYGISKHECRGMAMKSRAMLAVRMEHADRPMGAVAVETLDENFIDESLVDRVNGGEDTVVRWAIETASAVMDSMKDDIERWIAGRGAGVHHEGPAGPGASRSSQSPGSPALLL